MGNRLTHLDLFSGIGGFALAARWAGIETIQFVEYEPYAQKVLAKNFKGVPIHGDIKNFSATGIVSPFLLTGGYPCQPFSQAGKRRGKEDDRHLWPEMLRVIRECRPTWVLAENVSGHIKLGLEEVLLDLESESYQSQVFHVGAVAKDAPHRRMRLWIVAWNSNSENVEKVKDLEGASESTSPSGICRGPSDSENVANSQYSSDRTNGGKEREEDRLQVINRQEGLSGVSGGTGGNSRDVAYSNSSNAGSKTDKRRTIQQGARGAELSRTSEDVAYSQSKRVEGCRSGGEQESHTYGQEGLPLCEGERSGATEGESIPRLGGTLSDGIFTWMDEPDIPRVGVKIPDRAKRLKAIGNAIVPEVAYEIIRRMT